MAATLKPGVTMTNLKTFLPLVCVVAFAMHSSAQDIKPINEWAGKHRDSALAKNIPPNGLITDGNTLKKVWSDLLGDRRLPRVNFGREIVFVLKVGGPNRPFRSNSRLDGDGNLQITAAATKMGGPGFGFLMLHFPREKIKSINGARLPKAGGDTANKKEGVYVEVVGKVETGIMAIGGETTGTIIKAGNITFELDIKKRELVKVAEANNGKMVVVKGQLTRKRGVERGDRWIVVVKALKPRK